MSDNKIIVGSPINGISLNGLEYLLNEDGSVMEFNSKEEAVAFLKDHDYSHEDMMSFVFEKTV